MYYWNGTTWIPIASVIGDTEVIQDVAADLLNHSSHDNISVQYDDANGLLILSAQGAVLSVNGQSGSVQLTTTNIPEGTNLYFTDSRAILASASTIATASAAAVTQSNLFTTSLVNTASTASILTASAAAVNSPILIKTTDTGTVTSTMILDGTITTADISASAITTDKIANNAITNVKIADGNVNRAKIADGAVNSIKIASGSIVDINIGASAAIAWTKIAPSSTVSATELGYLDGVTSSIQNQIDSKLSESTASATYATITSLASAVSTASANTTSAINALTTTDIEEGSNQYFTNERAQDAVALSLASGSHSNITVLYDDNNNSISLVGSATVTDEQVQDSVAPLFNHNLHSNVTVVYNDSTNKIILTAAAGGGGGSGDATMSWWMGT
jgi:hypothetical protein